jgi:hypothetical protein
MTDRETQYHVMKQRIIEAMRVAQEADDGFIEFLLSMPLAEIEERHIALKAAKAQKSKKMTLVIS